MISIAGINRYGRMLPLSSNGEAGVRPNQGGWSSLPDTLGGSTCSARVGNKLYSGLYLSGDSKWFEFDIGTSTWSVKTGSPGPGTQGAIAMTDGVYVYGGLGRNASSVKKLFRYDPSLDTWTEITTYPGSGTIGLWSGYYNGVLIVGGGTDVIDIHGNFHSIYSECWKYNIAGNSWAPCASCPAGLCYSCSAVWADKLYVCGGHYLDGVPKKTLYRYNIVDDTWSTMTEITGLGRSYAAMAAGDGKLFCGGGNNHWSQAWYQTDFYIYDILSDTWAPMANWPDANCNHAPSQVYAGKLHCWGPSYKHYEYTI